MFNFFYSLSRKSYIIFLEGVGLSKRIEHFFDVAFCRLSANSAFVSFKPKLEFEEENQESVFSSESASRDDVKSFKKSSTPTPKWFKKL